MGMHINHTHHDQITRLYAERSHSALCRACSQQPLFDTSSYPYAQTAASNRLTPTLLTLLFIPIVRALISARAVPIYVKLMFQHNHAWRVQLLYKNTACTGGWDKLSVHMVKLTFHKLVHSDIQEVCGSSRIVTALALMFTRTQWGATDSYLMQTT